MITLMPRAATTRERGVRNAARTREAILGRAVDLASVEGLEGLTIGRLAGELGMSKSGLFGHFGSKEGLQLATVEEASGRFIAEVIEPTFAVPEGADRLRALGESYIDYLERGVFSGGCFFAAASVEFDDRPGPVGDRVRESVASWMGYLEGQAKAAGAADPELLAFELHALAQGANSAFRLFGDPRAFKRARQAMKSVAERELPEHPRAGRRRQASSRAK
jgi:AcrR family transcriptional regulator